MMPIQATDTYFFEMIKACFPSRPFVWMKRLTSKYESTSPCITCVVLLKLGGYEVGNGGSVRNSGFLSNLLSNMSKLEILLLWYVFRKSNLMLFKNSLKYPLHWCSPTCTWVTDFFFHFCILYIPFQLHLGKM